MNPRERVWAALRGDVVDRPPISFWGHVYHRESSAAEMAELVAALLKMETITGENIRVDSGRHLIGTLTKDEVV